MICRAPLYSVLFLLLCWEPLPLPSCRRYPGHLLLWHDYSSDCLTDRSVCGYQCVHIFIIPMHSGCYSSCKPMWSTSVVLLFTQPEHLLEIPNWRVCQRSIYNMCLYLSESVRMSVLIYFRIYQSIRGYCHHSLFIPILNILIFLSKFIYISICPSPFVCLFVSIFISTNLSEPIAITVCSDLTILNILVYLSQSIYISICSYLSKSIRMSVLIYLQIYQSIRGYSYQSVHIHQSISVGSYQFKFLA